jgi:hypothetical protein
MPETANGRQDNDGQDKSRGGRRKPRRDGVPPKKETNRWPSVQVAANEVGTAFQDSENCLCSRLNRKFITQWSTVLAIVFELRTGG